MIRWMAATLATVCLSAAPADAQGKPEPSRSRSGVVLFQHPADRKRQEEPAFTLLKSVDPAAKTYDICIRPPVEAKGTAADALTAHAQMIAQAVKIQPASDAVSYRHPAGFDVAVRGYYVGLPDGRVLTSYAYALKAGARSAVVEFVAADPKILTESVKGVVAFIEGCRLAHAEVLVAGDPPLTLYDVEETTDFLQWMVDVPFTTDQREVFRAEIIDGWKKKDAETIESVGQVFKMRAELAKLPPDKQDLVRKQTEGEVVAGLRKETDGASKLLVEIYESARKPIAEGDPPLTRQQADSALELFYFMAVQLEGVQAKPTPAEKDAWAKRLGEGWPKLDGNVRKQMTAMPLVWAATRASWAEMTEADREEIKKVFAAMDVIKEMRAVFAKAKSDGGGNAAAAISKMQQDHKMQMSLLKTSYDSTMTQMAAMRNMTDNRYRWSYRPR